MGTGASTTFGCTIASFATSSSALDLGGSWDKVFLVVPSMTSNTALAIQSSDSFSGTYRRVTQPSVNSSTVATNDYIIASAANNRIVPLPAGIRYLKVEATAIISFSANFTVIVGN